MIITKKQLEQELSAKSGKRLNLVIFGMSSSGKTHWSKLLSQEYRYKHIEFDDLIGRSPELASLIKDVAGNDNAEKLGNYFGMPWAKGFEAKEKVYLSLERRFMANTHSTGSIFDLTGSCIYHTKEMQAIRAGGLMIYLETSQDKQKEMLQIFLANPKPVCWNGIFKRNDRETDEEALARCYPLLLAYRAKLYEQFADVTLPHEVHRNLKRGEDFVGEVKKRLPKQLET